jgi:hypothetical protein
VSKRTRCGRRRIEHERGNELKNWKNAKDVDMERRNWHIFEGKFESK